MLSNGHEPEFKALLFNNKVFFLKKISYLGSPAIAKTALLRSFNSAAKICSNALKSVLVFKENTL